MKAEADAFKIRSGHMPMTMIVTHPCHNPFTLFACARSLHKLSWTWSYLRSNLMTSFDRSGLEAPCEFTDTHHWLLSFSTAIDLCFKHHAIITALSLGALCCFLGLTLLLRDSFTVRLPCQCFSFAPRRALSGDHLRCNVDTRSQSLDESVICNCIIASVGICLPFDDPHLQLFVFQMQ